MKAPELPAGFPANNEIDRFIAAKITSVTAQNASLPKGGVDYFREIQPILETKCYDCHRGAKVKGGLKLDTLVDAQKRRWQVRWRGGHAAPALEKAPCSSA